MRLYILLVCVLLSAFLFSACASTPAATIAPTIDVSAVQTEAAATTIAKITANAPKATATSEPTDTPQATQTSVPTNTALPTDTPLPTNTLSPTATATATSIPPTATKRPPTKVPTPKILEQPPIPKEQVTTVKGWEISYVGELRDKTLFFFDAGKTAFGVWVTIEFRVRNLQTGTDNMGRTVDFAAVDQDGKLYLPSFDGTQNARWEYCGCSTVYTDVDPGQGTVVVVTFDVPETTKTLTIVPIEGTFSSKPIAGALWRIENVDAIPPFKPK
jgi:hypothetical protein